MTMVESRQIGREELERVRERIAEAEREAADEERRGGRDGTDAAGVSGELGVAGAAGGGGGVAGGSRGAGRVRAMFSTGSGWVHCASVALPVSRSGRRAGAAAAMQNGSRGGLSGSSDELARGHVARQRLDRGDRVASAVFSERSTASGAAVAAIHTAARVEAGRFGHALGRGSVSGGDRVVRAAAAR